MAWGGASHAPPYKKGLRESRQDQVARNKRERQLTRFALPYDYTCFADEVLHLNKKYLNVVLCTITAYMYSEKVIEYI